MMGHMLLHPWLTNKSSVLTVSSAVSGCSLVSRVNEDIVTVSCPLFPSRHGRAEQTALCQALIT